MLTDAAGLKPRRGFKYHFKVTLYKLKRKLKIADNNAGSADYKVLSPAMKRVFTSVVNTFLDDYLDKIKCPTLLIWGDKDLSLIHIYPRFNLKKSRIDHVYRTAKAAILLAKLNGADTEKTIRAALLHDIAKYLTREDLDKEGIKFTPQMQALPAPCVHQLTRCV